MKMKMCIVVMLVSVLSVIQSANAVLITRGSTTVFSDDFETASDPSPYAWEQQQSDPSTYPPSDSDPDNPSVGDSWTVKDGSNYWDVQVTNAPAQGYDPGPYQGSNYLRLKRPAGATAEAIANFSRSSEDIHIEFMAFVEPTDDTHDFGVQIRDSDGAGRVFLICWWDSVDVKYHDGNGWQDTGIDYTPSKWQKWEIDYSPANSTFVLTIDNTSTGSLSEYGHGPVGQVAFQAAYDGAKAYVDSVSDAVPEPATIGLLSLSLVFLRRRR